MSVLSAIEPALQNALAALIIAFVPYVVFRIEKIVSGLKKTESKVAVIEKQGNSQQEQILRVRLATAERNLCELPDSQANKTDVESARMALDGHLRMQSAVDEMKANKK